MHPGPKIRQYRLARQMSLGQVASELDKDKGNLSKLERGEIGYSPELLEDLAALLQCEIWEFFAPDGIDGNSISIAKRWTALPDAYKVEVQNIFLRAAEQDTPAISRKVAADPGTATRPVGMMRRVPHRAPGSRDNKRTRGA